MSYLFTNMINRLISPYNNAKTEDNNRMVSEPASSLYVTLPSADVAIQRVQKDPFGAIFMPLSKDFFVPRKIVSILS